jgi:beta-N-acetylhexosaminidase
LREVVGTPEHRAVAANISQRAITLLRDQDNLIPLKTPGRTFVVQYMPETELRAGRAFAAAIRSARTGVGPVTAVKILPTSTRYLLDSLGRMADSAAIVIVAPHVRRVEGEGRPTIPNHIAAWIDTLAQRRPVVVAAFGNPYVIRQFPAVKTYMVTYGVTEDLEKAAAAALFGLQPITGRAPVSLPGFFAMGDGIQRP